MRVRFFCSSFFASALPHGRASAPSLSVDAQRITSQKEKSLKPLEALSQNALTTALVTAWVATFFCRARHDLSVFDINFESRSLLPHVGDRQLHMLVDVALQETRAVLRAE